MSMTEIIDEVSKLSVEERRILFQKLNEMEVGDVQETPELLAAIHEARSGPPETDVSAEELRNDVIRWARTK